MVLAVLAGSSFVLPSPASADEPLDLPSGSTDGVLTPIILDGLPGNPDGPGLGIPVFGSPPVAVDDEVVVPSFGAGTVDVLANDSDPDGDLDPSSLTITTPPAFGMVTVDPDTLDVTYSMSFAPADDPIDDGADGADEVEPAEVVDGGSPSADLAFGYTVCDLLGQCSSATVAVVPTTGGGNVDGPGIIIVIGPIDGPVDDQPPVFEPPDIQDPPDVSIPLLPDAPLIPQVPQLPQDIEVLDVTIELPETVAVDPPAVVPEVPADEPTPDPAPETTSTSTTSTTSATVPDGSATDPELGTTRVAVPGGTFTISGLGCEAGDPVVITIDDALVARTTADRDGGFRADDVVAPTEIGRHEVVVACGGSTATTNLDLALTSSERPADQNSAVLAFFLLLAAAIVHGREQTGRRATLTLEVAR